ncbi:MAG TPA: hypothetical protein VF191_02600 [Cyclobacteriaceae bacterium]
MVRPDQIENSDLYLRIARGQNPKWEPLASPSRYVHSLRRTDSKNGNVYLQGVVLNSQGSELSLRAVADLIDVHGHDAIHHLDGDFVIAVDDSRHGIWCATNQSAAFPLYYKLTNDELVITTCAENMTLRSADDLDLECIAMVLSCGYPWGDMTLLKAWKALRPGHMLRIDRNNNAVVTCYFDPENDESVQGYQSRQELIESIDRALESIASRHDRVLLPLSGGTDSRLIAVRCHALGIPFEAITFVANVPDGADFDVATRLVKVFGVKHHRWQWDASSKSCLSNFENFCYATGGTNDAFPSYPDGMSYFANVAARFTCALRGDHILGWGPYSDDVAESAWILGLKVTDNIDWALRPELHNRVSITSIFERLEGVSATGRGDTVNAWRHMSYRKNRSPRYIMPIAQLQSRFTEVANPLQTKEIVARISRTDTLLRDSKRIAQEALTAGSPPDVNSIPFTSKSTWRDGEPLLSVAPEVLREMIEVAEQPGILSEVINAQAIVANYKAFLNGGGGRARKGLLGNVKKMIRNTLPVTVRAMMYQGKAGQGVKSPPYMTFKRYFAMKVYLDRILQGQN